MASDEVIKMLFGRQICFYRATLF